jgi:hypothetical protein
MRRLSDSTVTLSDSTVTLSDSTVTLSDSTVTLSDICDTETLRAVYFVNFAHF